MGNELKGLTSHSAEYFGDTRDYWWRDETIAAAASQWGAEHIRSVLDVGCGVGHWGRLLARALPAARFVGIDREPLWVEKAGEKASARGLAERFTYQTGAAESLPFEDGTFDLVTCQTVLMHLREPGRGLAEMARVARPGGLVVVAEPTNLMSPLLDSIIVGDAPEVTASLLRCYLVCLQGKLALGEGNSLIGESLPVMFATAGLRAIEIRANDRAAPMVPPYESPSERATVEDFIDMAEREIWVWPRAVTHRYFAAGGGAEAEFDALWSMGLAQGRRVADAIREKRYSCSGGALFYLVWGRKPRPGE